jgi:hypothetical protein
MVKLSTKIANATRAATRIISEAVRGGTIRAPKDVVEMRMKICDVCDRNVDGECQECGCVISLKTRCATEACDIGKWPALAGKSGDKIINGYELLDYEQGLRDVFEPQGRFCRILNGYQHAAAEDGGCTTCKKKRYGAPLLSFFVNDMKQMDASTKKELRHILKDVTAIRDNKGRPMDLDELLLK